MVSLGVARKNTYREGASRTPPSGKPDEPGILPRDTSRTLTKRCANNAKQNAKPPKLGLKLTVKSMLRLKPKLKLKQMLKLKLMLKPKLRLKQKLGKSSS